MDHRSRSAQPVDRVIRLFRRRDCHFQPVLRSLDIAGHRQQLVA